MDHAGNSCAKVVQSRWTSNDDELLLVTVAQFEKSGQPRYKCWDHVAATVNRSIDGARSRFFTLKKKGEYDRIKADEFLCTGFLVDMNE